MTLTTGTRSAPRDVSGTQNAPLRRSSAHSAWCWCRCNGGACSERDAPYFESGHLGKRRSVTLSSH